MLAPEVSRLSFALRFTMSQLPISANKQKKCDGCGKEGADLKKCSACLSVCYCSSACQRVGWPGHRAMCKRIQLRINAKDLGGSGLGAVGSRPTAPLSSVKRYHEADVYSACYDGQLEDLEQVFKQRGLDVNCAHPDNGTTAMHAAAQEGHDKCLSAIIQYGGADLAKANKNGDAPIHLACSTGRIACLLILLDNGIDANVHTADGDGTTPAMFCCVAGHVKCLALLLDRGADPDLVDRDGLTPAHYACETGQLKCLQLVIARRANFNAYDGSGDTPLDLARRFGHLDCVELLLENNAVGAQCVEDLPILSEAQKVRLRVLSECSCSMSNALLLLLFFIGK
jgi:ankyrin repeat protein